MLSSRHEQNTIRAIVTLEQRMIEPKLGVFYELDYHELENIVKEHLKPATDADDDYSFVAMEECRNDTDHRFMDITKAEWADKLHQEYDLEEVKRFIEDGIWHSYTPGNRAILLELVNRDILPEGNYLIHVSW